VVQDPALSVGLTKARPSTRAIKSAGGSATPAVRAGHGFQPGRGRAADRGVPPFQRPDARSRVGSFPRFAVACLVWCGPGRRSPGGRGILCRHRPKVEWTSHYLLTARAQHGSEVNALPLISAFQQCDFADDLLYRRSAQSRDQTGRPPWSCCPTPVKLGRSMTVTPGAVPDYESDPDPWLVDDWSWSLGFASSLGPDSGVRV